VTTAGIILAGGRGTRLGPLAAQISKALVSVGNRPQVVNQIFQLVEAGAEHVVVVTSPDTDTQVADVISRAGLDYLANTVVQHVANGPVDALLTGLSASRSTESLVLFSDTAITEPLPREGDWVGVATEYDDTRSWCYQDDVTGQYIDGVTTNQEPATIGAYRFSETQRAIEMAREALGGLVYGMEVGMAPFLTGYIPMQRKFFTTWTDVGDIFSLAASRRRRFISRPKHSLHLDGMGVLTKYGVGTDELDFMDNLGERPLAVQTLFPTVTSISHRVCTYSMEYMDLPTLAELWLYWPGRPDTWATIVKNLIDRMQCMWDPKDKLHFPAGKWMATKAMRRTMEWGVEPVSMELFADAADIIGDDFEVDGHGDLQFTNIMYSLNSGGYKLIDPRGTPVPLIYEFAKLGYSHVFSSITHGLMVEQLGEWMLTPHRRDEERAIMDVLTSYYPEQKLNAAMGLICLAATPLHSAKEAEALFQFGRSYLRKAGL
jgi:hypothetical protein